MFYVNEEDKMTVKPADLKGLASHSHHPATFLLSLLKGVLAQI